MHIPVSWHFYKVEQFLKKFKMWFSRCRGPKAPQLSIRYINKTVQLYSHVTTFPEVHHASLTWKWKAAVSEKQFLLFVSLGKPPGVGSILGYPWQMALRHLNNWWSQQLLWELSYHNTPWSLLPDFRRGKVILECISSDVQRAEMFDEFMWFMGLRNIYIPQKIESL